jgi:hypothetical protein
MAEQFTFPDEDTPTDVDVKVEGADEIEVEVVDDTPEPDRGRKPLDREIAEPTEDELESYSDKVKARIKELTHARHDERRAKEATLREKQELERMARALIDENKKLKQYVNTGEQQFAETAKSAAQSALDIAKRKYKEAYESGDADAVVAAQEELTEAKMRAEAAKNFRPTTLQVDEDPVQMQASAPQQPQIDDKTLRWQAKNQWFGAPGYEEITAFSLGLHKRLVDSGVDPRSDEYFERIDSRLKSKFPEVFGAEEKAVEAPKKPATVVAPATRSTSAKKIRLTATQLALAKKFGLTPQQYAAEVARSENSNG